MSEQRWAVVEVMGHRTYVGRVEEVVFAGAAMVRITIPEHVRTRTQTDYIEPGDPLFDEGMLADAQRGHYARKQRVITDARPAQVVDLGGSSIFAISWCSEAYALSRIEQSHVIADETLRTEGPWEPVRTRPVALLEQGGAADEVPW